MTEEEASKYEPINWLLVFSPNSTLWWVDRLVRGRFKHVAVTGFSIETQAWVVYEVTLVRTQILIMPDAAWNRWIGTRVNAGASVLRVERGAGHWSVGRLGSWCVPAVKRLIGLRSGALRPDRLFADCLRAGAEVVHEGSTGIPAIGAGNRCAEGG